jgi:phosphoserine phosphatase
MTAAKLPSWRPGPTREAVEAFLDSAEMLPIEQRVAAFDVDGTLWSERPRSTMVEFMLADLRAAVAETPALAERPEYRAALVGDQAAVARLGVVNVTLALLELYGGLTPAEFDRRARAHFADARHPQRGVPYSQTRYRPMLELIGELRARHFSVSLVSGSGSEFMRVVSADYFGVRPESVAGSQAGYELVREGGVPILRRTRDLVGDPNEGPAKVANVQRLLGRRPILAAGNSAGDAELLDYAQAFEGPSLALLIDHDDAEREYAYASAAASVASSEPITQLAAARGWTVVSMQNDWGTIFADT